MKPIHLPAHYLEDEIVLDGVEGINYVKSEKKVEGYIAGGMAVQGYLPKEEYRETIDLDFTLCWNGSLTLFKQIMDPFTNALKDKGYKFNYNKKGLTYELTVLNENSSLLLQHPRRSYMNYERNKHSLEREISNSRILTKGGISYAALSPEDLALHKMNRSLTFMERYSLSLPNNSDIPSLRKSTDALKKELIARLGNIDLQDVARLRLISDLLDIKCLATHVGFNKSYLLEGSKDWMDDRIDTEDMRKLLDKLEIDLTK